MKLFKFLMGKKRKALLLLIDIVIYGAISLVYLVAANAPDSAVHVDEKLYMINVGILALLIFGLRICFGTYQSVWRYTNTNAYLKLVIADGLAGVVALTISRLTGIYTGVWHLATIASFTALVTLCTRFTYRWIYKHRNISNADPDAHKIPVAIVGAGQLGALLAEELIYNKRANYKPMFFIDRDKGKAGSKVAGLKIHYEDDAVIDYINSQGISEIFVAIDGLDNETTEQIYSFYSRTRCKVKLYDTEVKGYYTGDGSSKRAIREFQIEDLLFRKSMKITDPETKSYYEGKVVLVTGGGGSIGSELCRQIAKCGPKKLIILDIYENNAYDIQQELIRHYGDSLDLAVEIASVRDRVRLEAVFSNYRPQVVFHAAAHKHVPLMEHSNCEAIKNNVMGTYNAADMAEKYEAEKFILVSTDKAVNPTNIMGASKRMCEMVIQCRKDSKTSFAAVRFGNVLGSNGSVIPLFKSQISNGGPITITDKRIIRYFMTIPEASQLVMQAGAMAKKGELFVLDMGKPVKIYDLAVNMIKLSGYEPEVDIKIEEIGLRPGEKLYEELLMKTEELDKTDNNMIFIEKDEPLSREEVEAKLRMLNEAVKDAETELGSPKIKAAMMRVVPTFRDPNVVNRKAAQSEEMKAAENTDADA